jgi:hypothetical protein
MLWASSEVCTLLQAEMECQPYVLGAAYSQVVIPHYLPCSGDTSYSPCCVDEVAAQHHPPDVIVHFGHSCLSPCRRQPVLFVFEHLALDTDQLERQLLPKLASAPAGQACMLVCLTAVQKFCCLSWSTRPTTTRAMN